METRKTIEISYNPYKIDTKMSIDGVNVCQDRSYERFKKFIENRTPLQTWIEPIDYEDWGGFVNETSDPERNDSVTVKFSGRVIDFEDLKRSIHKQNEERPENTRITYKFEHTKVLDDRILSQNIEDVVKELKSDRFRKLVSQRTTRDLTEKYEALEKNFQIAKEDLFYIVFAGAYSSGKSTLLNALIKHNILPMDSDTCTSKNCRIRHDSSLGTKVSLTAYGDVKNGKESIIIPKSIYDTDEDCAAAFWKICPPKNSDTEDRHPEIKTIELCANLSHLYPKSVSDDKFTIVLIDTPGMDSVASSINGTNKHAEIALEAISMESKPMIVLCVDGHYSENKNIGEFMREIIKQSKESSGFNDRFLFLMNKSDNIDYDNDKTPESKKKSFAKYLTDSSKWNIECNEKELKQLAEDDSHFVPRVFMTAGKAALAIQSKAFDFTDKEIEDDKNKRNLLENYENFEKKICGRVKSTDFYLSRYCDIPKYRKEEIEAEFKKALEEDHNNIRATELQCGLVPVEFAIKDYIERYAYPIKVRDLLNTFEDILEDVDSFTKSILDDLIQKKKELGEKNSEREEVSQRKGGVEEKIAALERAKEDIKMKLKELNNIKPVSTYLQVLLSEYMADIESNDEISFIRKIYFTNNGRVETGQKSRSEVECEINTITTNVTNLFDCTLRKTNEELDKIESVHNEQIKNVFAFLRSAITELERSEVLSQGEYKFTDSVTWKMNFSNINFDRLASNMKKSFESSSKIRNSKKDEWGKSQNLFKIFISWFMPDYFDIELGYYDISKLWKSIEEYSYNLQKEFAEMDTKSTEILDDSKKQVRDLIDRLLEELRHFLDDIKKQEERIEELGDSINSLNNEINSYEETLSWLNELKEKSKGE